MTVKEYNKEFLPKITAAQYLANNLELAIDHAEISEEDKANVRHHLAIHACWSEETKEIILKALEYYRVHEGIEKLENKYHIMENHYFGNGDYVFMTEQATSHKLQIGKIVEEFYGNEPSSSFYSLIFRDGKIVKFSMTELETTAILLKAKDKN